MCIFSRLAATAVFLVVPFSASRAHVDVYRCVLDGGHISYQQIPCHYKDTPMKLQDRRIGWSALRPGERGLLNSYQKEGAALRPKASGPQQNPAKETRSCWTRRKQLEAVRSKLRHGYKLKEGDELRRKRDNYEDYLQQFLLLSRPGRR